MLAGALSEALEAVMRCRRCRMLTEGELCSICANTQRDASLLCVVEWEGMLRMRMYTEGSRRALAAAGAAAGVPLRRGLRTVAATDGLIALRAGYATCTLGGVDETKFPANYHWPSDTPDNLTWESVEGAVAVCEAYVRNGAGPAGL